MAKRIWTTLTLALLVLSGCGDKGDAPMSPSPTTPSPSSGYVGIELREAALTTPASQLGFAPDGAYPTVYGVLVDWPQGDYVATVAAMRDGNTSLYTTTPFNIIGGGGHAIVRRAAKHLVRTAERFVDASEPLTLFPYPSDGRVNYYLLTYSGVRGCSGDLDAITEGSDPTTELFAAALDVMKVLRVASEAQTDGSGQ